MPNQALRRTHSAFPICAFKQDEQAAWQRNVEHAVRNRITLQHRQALIADLERSINSPPAPEPEPEIIYLSPEEQGPPKRAIRNC